MPAVTRWLVALAIGAAVALAPGRARAQEGACVAMGGCAEGCACGDDACIARQCGGPSADDGGGDGDSSDSSAGSDGGYREDPAAAAAALQAEMEERERSFELQFAASRAIASAEAEESLRRNNDQGIAAYHKHDYRRAVAYFEAAALLDPTNAQTQKNLADARAAEAFDVHARVATAGPITKDLHGEAVPIATEIPTQLTPAHPELRSYLTQALDWLGGEASQVVSGTVGELVFDLSTPWGLPLRYASNVDKLARDVDDGAMRVARGEMSLQEGKTLDLHGGAIVMNFGGDSGRFLQDIVEARSADVAVLHEGDHRFEEIADHGIESLGERVGAQGVVTRAWELGKQNSEAVMKWVTGR